MSYTTSDGKNLQPPALAGWVSEEAQAHFATHVAGIVTPPGDIAAIRAHYDAINHARVEIAKQLYPTRVERQVLNSVPVDVVSPLGQPDNGRRLICLHGGAFMWGSGAGALVEAIPVAAVSGCTVIAVDYRLAPEYLFPAATDNVVACYQALLEDRPATRIALYGSSAGAMLSAQVVARLIADGTPVPGAVAMLHGAGLDLDGDSMAVAGYLNGMAAQGIPAPRPVLPYLAGTHPGDPLVTPGDRQAVLEHFPPSLLVTGTRDFAASSVFTMHRRLHTAGVPAELVVFDGLWHTHHVDTALPESREVFELLGRFFAMHLT
ncbi:hypothetical protein BWP39_23135 [Paraburkholderia acidicola]|uniref:Alpha/beta hydrolase fold-3 domain-containing protein n=1 Tax=Paraburkholderia acidicola TaxID=1912599 RepID=A0A2A4EPI2_9BURK|nr:alpha/beta hydrolase fold domain-containing protein [Paraburkholderia acidicola]PCE22577.1 hypothetical protein BWP39_23135 [Paraburkholderia acidicola]